jgi:hypothetical protein
VSTGTLNEAEVYVVETERGFTATFDRETIETLERLGLIRRVRVDHLMHDGQGNGIGAMHLFYGPTTEAAK